MTPFFIISTPRSRGTLLMRMLDATPGVRCAGESSPMLGALRRLQRQEGAHAGKAAAESWPMHRHHAELQSWSDGIAAMLPLWIQPGGDSTHYGLRTSFLGREGWEDAVDWWSWLLTTWRGAKLIFLGRDQGEIELSMMQTRALWRPSYGNCAGHCGSRVNQHLRSMADFHLMNPTSTTVLDAADLSDFDKAAAALSRVGIPLDRGAWESELAVVSGRGRDLSATLAMPEPALPPPADNPLFRMDLDFDQAMAAAAAAGMPVEVPSKPEEQSLQEWLADPFGDRELEAIRKAHKPRLPRKLKEIPAEHERAVIYPWLSAAAAWGEEELRHSLRSIDRHLADKDCPIYVLGDRAPAFLKEGGRVIFKRMEGYSRSRHRGLWEAFQFGLQIAHRCLWMNDDIYLLQDLDWRHFEVALTEGILNGKEARLIKARNIWQRGLGVAVVELRQRGIEVVRRFATHTPFLFERERSLEILREFRLPYKGGWVTRYHNYHATDHRPCGRLKTATLPAPPAARFLNHNDGTLTPELKDEIRARFPDPAPWEITIPKIIHQTWATSEIPRDTYPEVWTDSWKQHHPGWEHRLWTDADLVALAAEHYPAFVTLLKEARGVIKADVGRLLVLHRHGGLYADLDYMALKPMDELIRSRTACVSSFADGYTHNALMACCPGNAMMLAAAKEARSRWQRSLGMAPEWISGPLLLSDLVASYRPDHWPAHLVCPIDWRTGARAGNPLDPGPEFPGAHAVHLWVHNW